jgi:hypothetical protein
MLPTKERLKLYIRGLRDAGLQQELRQYKAPTPTLMDIIMAASEADGVLQTTLS